MSLLANDIEDTKQALKVARALRTSLCTMRTTPAVSVLRDAATAAVETLEAVLFDQRYRLRHPSTVDMPHAIA